MEHPDMGPISGSPCEPYMPISGHWAQSLFKMKWHHTTILDEQVIAGVKGAAWTLAPALE